MPLFTAPQVFLKAIVAQLLIVSPFSNVICCFMCTIILVFAEAR